MMPSTPIALYGTEEPPRPSRLLRAGALSAELEGGAIRYLKVGGVEIVRGIDYLVRDTSWGTAPATIEDLVVEQHGGGFTVTYEGRIDSGAIRLGYEAVITGDRVGELVFTVSGTALEPFETCRCGFILLHPVAGMGGRAVEVTHTDGTTESARFPASISPAQPIMDIRALAYEAAPGLRATLTLEAELPHDPAGKFEMEDQRNWSDASFKTYVGSLRDAVPYTMPAGQRLTQTITVRVDGAAAATAAADGAAGAQLRLGAAGRIRLPRFGIGLGPGVLRLPEGAGERLAVLGPQHLVAWLDLRDPEAAAHAEYYAAIATGTGAPLQLEVILPEGAAAAAACAEAAALCAAHGLEPAAVLPCPAEYLRSYQPSGPWPEVAPLESIYAAARDAFPAATIVGGMPGYFTELNRNWPPAEAIDAVSHTTSPLVHAADDRSVMETLEALPAIAGSVRERLPDLPYRVGPSMLAMRFNPYGAAPAANPDNRRIAMADQDPRQRGLFAAAWTVGYAAALAPFGLEAVALHEACGPAGLVAVPQPWPQPWFDEVGDGVVVPAFHPLRVLAMASGEPVLPVEELPAGLAGLAWSVGEAAGILLANLTAEPRTLTLDAPAEIVVLDAASFADACRDPRWLENAPAQRGATVELGPYATALARLERRAAAAPAGPRLKGAVIGCGFFAMNHLHAWTDELAHEVEIVALCDRDPARAEAAAARFGIARSYGDAAELFAGETLDFVDIVTTVDSHRELVELAARHKVPVICQKPFGRDMAECRAMVEACASAGVPLMVHENFRWQAPLRRVQEVVASGRIGRPFFARVSFRHGFDVYANQPYLAEGERLAIEDVGVHLLDLARCHVGEVTRLYCRTQRINPRVRGEDCFTALLDHADGAVSIVDCSFSSQTEPDPFPQTLVRIEGDAGTVELLEGYRMVVSHDGERVEEDVEAEVPAWGERPWHVVQESVAAIQRHWVESLRAGTPPATSGADNLRTFALVEAAYESAARGQAVAIEGRG